MINKKFFLERLEELSRLYKYEHSAAGKWNIRHNASTNYNMCKAFTGESIDLDPVFDLLTDKAGVVVLNGGWCDDKVN